MKKLQTGETQRKLTIKQKPIIHNNQHKIFKNKAKIKKEPKSHTCPENTKKERKEEKKL